MPKTNETLGREVNDYLTSLGINTPTTSNINTPKQEKISLISNHMSDILNILGLDLNDDSLQDTPNRVAKMFVDEIYSGLINENFPKCTTVENKFSHGDEFVLEKNITIYSDCEHHMRTIHGYAHIAYIPKDKVLGLSKLNRIAQYFSKRPQVQERLCAQISHAISYVTESPDVIVAIDAHHMCVSQRGVCDYNSNTSTISALGVFSQPGSHLRNEFHQAIK